MARHARRDHLLLLEVALEREVQEGPAQRCELERARAAALRDRQVAGGEVLVEVGHESAQLHAFAGLDGRRWNVRAVDQDHARVRQTALDERERPCAELEQLPADRRSADGHYDQRTFVVAQSPANGRTVAVLGGVEGQHVAEERVMGLGVPAPVGQTQAEAAIGDVFGLADKQTEVPAVAEEPPIPAPPREVEPPGHDGLLGPSGDGVGAQKVDHHHVGAAQAVAMTRQVNRQSVRLVGDDDVEPALVGEARDRRGLARLHAHRLDRIVEHGPMVIGDLLRHGGDVRVPSRLRQHGLVGLMQHVQRRPAREPRDLDLGLQPTQLLRYRQVAGDVAQPGRTTYVQDARGQWSLLLKRT